MEQTIERFRIFLPGQEVSRKDILDVVSPVRSYSDNEEEIIYVREDQSSIYADAFWCCTNALLFDLVTGVFDGEEDRPIQVHANYGQRAEFKRDKLEWMLATAKGILSALQTMDPEDEDYPNYYESEVEWLVNQLEKELRVNNPDVEYCYTCII